MMEERYRTIGTQIKASRLSQNISQAQLAERTNLSAPYISQIETAKKQVSLSSLLCIANILGVTVDWLLQGYQHADHSSYMISIYQILDDCSIYERSIIIDSATALKESLRSHQLEFLGNLNVR